MVDSMNYALTGISDQLENYKTLGEAIYRNSQIQDILSKTRNNERLYSKDYSDIRQQILVESSKYEYINYVALIDEKTGAVLTNKINFSLNPEKRKKILTAIEESKGKATWITEYGKESQMILARKIPCIANLGKDNLGMLIINIDIAALIRDTGVSEQEGFRCVLVDKEGNSLSDSGEYTNIQIKSIYNQTKDEKFAVAKMDDQRYFAVYREDRSAKWGYVYFEAYDGIYSRIYSNIKIILWIGFLCVSCIIFLNSIFTRDIFRRFDGLIQEFQAFSENISNRVPKQYSERNDEIGILYQQFDLMQEKVVQLIDENYGIELEKKRAQVEMLETQINPHFLYNTLQAINWRAKALHSREISQMVEALSQILQSTLANRKSMITVEEELDLTQQFVNIQQMRMEGKLIYEVSVSPQMLTVMIPKLIIQPLVENGISHSMNAMLEVNRVLVEIRQEEEKLAVYVRNNGSEFPEELLSKLNNKEIQPIGHGIGIMNINTRIKLTYGEEYGIDFYNREGYAVAKLLIPYDTEEENYV